MEVKCTYKNGEYDDPYEEYNTKGNIIKSGIYVDGQFKDSRGLKPIRRETVGLLDALNDMTPPTTDRKAQKREIVQDYHKKVAGLTPTEKRALKDKQSDW